MDSNRKGSSAHDIEHEMEDEARRMQRRVDELGRHVDEAAKKAEHTRDDANLAGDEALDTVAGDASERSTSSDDPASAVGNPADETS
jgi:hypothetical protein